MRSICTAFVFGLLAFPQSWVHGQNINKCLVNGKTIYSDRACPSNAIRHSVEMHHAKGIVSPDRDTVTDTIHRIEDESWVNAVPGRSITRTTTRQGKTTTSTLDNPSRTRAKLSHDNKQVICGAISSRIDQLDAMARQPQSASGQDWIRQEKEKERTEQFKLSC
jgi:hypothetical protein